MEPHRESWKGDFGAEAVRIERALGSALCRLHHIGSTAIPGIPAKPVIDILASVGRLEAVDARREQMERLGYEVMGEFGIPGRRYFRRTTGAGVRTHQIHAFAAGSPHLIRHLAFRDFLRSHRDVALEYGALKVRLADSCGGDMEAYMRGKEGFIREVESKALAWRANDPDAACKR
jgi:GrpB-like predicted nucleotidyltransferase (UPF0157 family)